MSIMNRRNAALGWAIWEVSKRAAAWKVRSAARSDPKRKRIVGGLVAGVR